MTARETRYLARVLRPMRPMQLQYDLVYLLVISFAVGLALGLVAGERLWSGW